MMLRLCILAYCLQITLAFLPSAMRRNILSFAATKVVDVALPDRSYPIYIGTGLLQAQENLILKHVTSKKALIVTNTRVGPLYSAAVRKVLESASKLLTFNICTFAYILHCRH